MKTDNAFLDQQRNIGDYEADQLVASFFANKKQSELYSTFRTPEDKIAASDLPNELKNFLIAFRSAPEWFNEESLLRGQELFKVHALQIMTLLGALALPYCYAGSLGNKALYYSSKMRQSPGHRLADTSEFIITVSTPNSFTSQGTGHVAVNKTRLIHAIARHHLLNKTWKSAWGSPINQEDMAGTNLAFSYIILMGMSQSGYAFSHEQSEDFIHLWRYIGYQLHIHDELLPPTFKHAAHLAACIRQRNFMPTEEGKELMHELLVYYRKIAPPDKSGFIASQIRWYLGKEVSGYLGLEAEPMKDFLVATINPFKQLQNLISPRINTYQEMVDNHARLKANLGPRQS